MAAPSASTLSFAWRKGALTRASRAVPAEMPIAFVLDGSAEAVMMATPADLEDFALGFALNERIIATPAGMTGVDIVEASRGIQLRISLEPEAHDRLTVRRRHRVGPVGCGLCGIEGLEDALPLLPAVTQPLRMAPEEIVAAVRAMAAEQRLNAETRAVHAAAFHVAGEGIVALREDVGRHNALDKLAGALWRAGRVPSCGAILMTSRLSVELVQKAAVMGAPILAAVSAPTVLAIEEAERAGITLAGIVREDGLEVFTHPHRISMDKSVDAG